MISLAGVHIAGRAPAVLCAGLLATLTAALAPVHRIRQFDVFTYPLAGAGAANIDLIRPGP